MKNSKIKICDTVIHPGEVANLALSLPEEYSCAPLYMPIKVIHGKKKGPCIVIFSVLDGTELNGLEIANRIFKSTNVDSVSGTIITIPAVNVYALTRYPSRLPSDDDIINCFPGDENGSFGERIAHLFTTEILEKADYCIELDTGGINHNILPQVYCDFKNDKSKKLAKAFQTPVVMSVDKTDNSLRKTTDKMEIPFLVYQGGEAMRFDEGAIQTGVEGIENVMHALKILNIKSEKTIKPIFSKKEEWCVSHKGGILHPIASLGQTIKKNEIIGTISDPFGADILESVRSPQEGIVVGINMSPLIHEGLPIFKIATFLDYDRAESVIEKWDQSQPDSYMG